MLYDKILTTMAEGKQSAPKMGGLPIGFFKRNYPLIPLFLAVGFGVFGAAGYTLRLAFRNPDVTWSLKKNPEPWQEYSDKQYKLYSSTPLGPSPAPKY